MKLKTIFSVTLGFQHLSLSSEMRPGMYKPSVQHMYAVLRTSNPRRQPTDDRTKPNRVREDLKH